MDAVKQIEVVNSALAVLPASVRDDFAGAAWLKLVELEREERRGDDVLAALKNHVRYLFRKDRHNVAQEAGERGAADPSFDAIELKDELSRFNRADRSIITAIMAGNSLRDIAESKGTSASTLCRRLKRLRGAA